MLLLTGCTTSLTASDVLGKIFVINTPLAVTETPVPLVTELAETIKTPVSITTPEPPMAYETQRQQIRALMEGYGFVDETQLSDAYWEQLSWRI